MNTMNVKQILLTTTALMLTLFLVAGAAARAANSTGTSAASPTPQATQAKPTHEQQRNDAKRDGDKSLDPGAVAALTETNNAIKAISEGKTDEAIAAIERATGKINILTARNPAAAFIPVNVEVTITDLAPVNGNAIRELSSAAQKAISANDYPTARALLDQLASEVRVRTYQLPLATYPAAMQEAARLLDQKKTKEAKDVLVTALNTLVAVDKYIPLPITVAQAALKEAQAERNKDKVAAQKHLANAKASLERAKTLGYESLAPEYASLNQSIVDLDKQLNGKEDTTSAFAVLKEKLDEFFDRLTKKPSSSQSAKS